MARRFARDLAYTRSGQLAAVASRDHARAAHLISAPGIAGQGARAFSDYDALVAHADVDAVYIATPSALHRDHALLAISAGKPVLCEKPLAGSQADTQAIVAAARAANVFCMEALWTRFLPAVHSLETLIAAIEPVRQIEATLGFARSERAGDPVTDPKLGGGALNDLGVYPLGLATTLLGDLDLVAAWVRRSGGPGTSVRDARALLTARAGAVAVSIGVSHSSVLANRLEIIGDSGRLVIDAPFNEAIGLRRMDVRPMDHRQNDTAGTLSSAVRASALWPKLRDLRARLIHSDGARTSGSYRGTGLQFQADEVARCVELGLTESPLYPLDRSLAVQSLITQIDQA